MNTLIILYFTFKEGDAHRPSAVIFQICQALSKDVEKGFRMN